MELIRDVGHVESRSVRLEMVLDIILDAPDGTPR